MHPMNISALALALSMSSPAAARTSPWTMNHCTISRMSSDGAVWSVKRQGKGALLTVTKPRWNLPKEETRDLNLYFFERYFGHYRPVKAYKVRGEPSLRLFLDEELLLAFRGLEAVRLIGKHDLTDWLDLDGSSKAYSRLAQC